MHIISKESEFRLTKIAYLQASFFRYKYVLRFEISVEDTFAMKVSKGRYDLLYKYLNKSMFNLDFAYCQCLFLLEKVM